MVDKIHWEFQDSSIQKEPDAVDFSKGGNSSENIPHIQFYYSIRLPSFLNVHIFIQIPTSCLTEIHSNPLCYENLSSWQNATPP
jgi:ribosomal protein S19E (S16A)